MRISDWSSDVCSSDLKAHTIIEEEIFYPAFLEATDDKDIHHEAEVEHEGAKHLIGEIEAAGPDDDYFRSEEHTSELQTLMRISYAVFCLKKTNITNRN